MKAQLFFVLFILGMASLSALSLTDGLVAYWAGEGNGSDASGNGYSLTALNGGTYGEGKYGQAFQLDGSDDRWEGSPDGTNSAFDFQKQFTLAAWVKVDQITGNLSHAPVICKWGQTGYGTANYGLNIMKDTKKVWFIASSTGTNVIEVTSTTALSSSSFYHIAGVYDGTALRVYVNGVLEASTPFTSNLPQNNVPMLLGGYNYSFTGYTGQIKGLVDEVAVYNRALSGSEIISLSAGISVPEPTSLFLIIFTLFFAIKTNKKK